MQKGVRYLFPGQELHLLSLVLYTKIALTAQHFISSFKIPNGNLPDTHFVIQVPLVRGTPLKPRLSDIIS
jgi:hypothetical protein